MYLILKVAENRLKIFLNRIENMGQRFMSALSSHTSSHAVLAAIRMIKGRLQAGSLDHLQVGDYEMWLIHWHPSLPTIFPLPYCSPDFQCLKSA